MSTRSCNECVAHKIIELCSAISFPESLGHWSNSYLYEVDQEINPFTTYEFGKVFVFENTAIVTCVTHQILKSVLIKKKIVSRYF